MSKKEFEKIKQAQQDQNDSTHPYGFEPERRPSPTMRMIGENFLLVKPKPKLSHPQLPQPASLSQLFPDPSSTSTTPNNPIQIQQTNPTDPYKFSKLIKQQDSISNIREFVDQMKVALDKKQHIQMSAIKKQLKKKRITQKAYLKKKYSIEKWTEKKEEEISFTKNKLVEGWKKAKMIMNDLAKDKSSFKRLLDKHRNSNDSGFSSMNFNSVIYNNDSISNGSSLGPLKGVNLNQT